MIDYRKVAKSSPIFNGLSEEEKDALLKDGKIRYLDKKEFLFHHGDPLLNFYITCSGTIQLFRSNSYGYEKTLHILTAQDIICGNEICESYDFHQFNAMAISDAAVIEFPKIWLRENVKKYGEFALNLLTLISHQAKTAVLETEHKTAMSVTQILVCFLQKLCMIYDLNPRGFKLPYSKKLIASRLGIPLETLSRTFKKLKEYGITVVGSNVVIGDLSTIEENVCDYCSIEEDCQVHENCKEKFNLS